MISAEWRASNRLTPFFCALVSAGKWLFVTCKEFTDPLPGDNFSLLNHPVIHGDPVKIDPRREITDPDRDGLHYSVDPLRTGSMNFKM